MVYLPWILFGVAVLIIAWLKSHINFITRLHNKSDAYAICLLLGPALAASEGGKLRELIRENLDLNAAQLSSLVMESMSKRAANLGTDDPNENTLWIVHQGLWAVRNEIVAEGKPATES